MSEKHAEREQPVTPLELFFDLVFVFALTQVTTVLSAGLDGQRLAHGRSTASPRQRRPTSG